MLASGRLVYGIALIIVLSLVIVLSTIGCVEGRSRRIRQAYGASMVISILTIIFVFNSL